jgi:hypothetical protein
MILTRLLLENTIYKLFTDRLRYFICVLLIPFTFMLDIILIIPEIIALILYRIIEGKDE